MMLALLAAASRASCEERLATVYRLLLWQSGCQLLPRRLAVAYVRLLKVTNTVRVQCRIWAWLTQRVYNSDQLLCRSSK